MLAVNQDLCITALQATLQAIYPIKRQTYPAHVPSTFAPLCILILPGFDATRGDGFQHVIVRLFAAGF